MDGVRLSARIWLPLDAHRHPVPALLEYIPYRKNDWTAPRDALRHPYLAGHGYACLRVDMRGSGDSEGTLLGEYLPQEQDDALQVIAWIAAQPWSTGMIGMFGKSWGGFNALQVAARRPPALKAILTLYSSDDRYTDDIHYVGGCLFGSDHFAWASTMLAFNARPPDPRHVGEGWREMWRERLERTPRYIDDWLRHQRRDAFLKARFRVRELRRHHVRGVCGGRLGRRLYQCGAEAHGSPPLPTKGPHRAVGTSVSRDRHPRPGDRLPAGEPALVGLLAQGNRHRHHG